MRMSTNMGLSAFRRVCRRLVLICRVQPSSTRAPEDYYREYRQVPGMDYLDPGFIGASYSEGVSWSSLTERGDR